MYGLPMTSRKINPASVAYISESRNALMVTIRLSHFLFTLAKAFVSCNTARNASMNEKALSIPRRKSMTKSKRIQCGPPGKVPRTTGQLPKTRPNDWY